MNNRGVLTLIGPLTFSLLLSLGCSSTPETGEGKINFLQASEVSSKNESVNNPLDEEIDLLQASEVSPEDESTNNPLVKMDPLTPLLLNL